jgi:hypothetical protein
MEEGTRSTVFGGGTGSEKGGYEEVKKKGRLKERGFW